MSIKTAQFMQKTDVFNNGRINNALFLSITAFTDMAEVRVFYNQ